MTYLPKIGLKNTEPVETTNTPPPKKGKTTKTETVVNQPERRFKRGSLDSQPGMPKDKKVKKQETQQSQTKVSKGFFKALSGKDPSKKYHASIIAACEKHEVELADYEEFMREYGKNMKQIPTISAEAITKAIMQENPAMLRVLKDLGANLGQVNTLGFTPLTLAVRENKINMIQLLIELGADLYQSDAEGKSPLSFAVEHYQMDVVELFASVEADFNESNDLGETPLSLAILNNDHEFTELLLRFGADQDYAKKIAQRRFVAQVWGLNKSSTVKDETGRYKATFSLEGLRTPYTLKMLSKYAADFFLQPQIPMPIMQKLEILDVINCAFPFSMLSFDEILSKVNIGKPYMILGGSDTHAISIILHRNQLTIFNRGLGSSDNSTTTYTVPSSMINEDFIKKLQVLHPDIQTFNKMIKGLKLKPVKEPQGLQHKKQKVGNCPWASSEGALGYLLTLHQDKKTAHDIYKQFTEFARAKSLHDSLASSPDQDIHMLEQIQEKLKNKSGLVSSRELLSEFLSRYRDESKH